MELSARAGNGDGAAYAFAANVIDYLAGAGYTVEGRPIDVVSVVVAETAYSFQSVEQASTTRGQRSRQLRATARLLETDDVLARGYMSGQG